METRNFCALLLRYGVKQNQITRRARSQGLPLEYNSVSEPLNLAQPNQPEDLILAHGGQIFFVLENVHHVGTGAMVPLGPGCLERRFDLNRREE